MSADLVIVSPHLDDAVLSAASQLTRPGACVITACTGEPAAGTPLGEWDRLTGAVDAAQRVRDRHAEDAAALATLGVARTERLGFPDGQHRPEGQPRTTTADLVAGLRPHLAEVPEVWAPAGIGCHPDHLAVRDAVLAAVDPGTTVHHYADVPYSLRYGWPASVTGLAAASPYLDVEVWLAEELAAAGLVGTAMTRTVHRLDADAQERKVAAMACYVTQIPALDYGGALATGVPAVVGLEVSWTLS
jgi:LmbE family N-acetylglucosaminyl deacetylase